jgi:CheY-like chemotaxis protein
VTYNSDKELIIGDKQRFCQILRNILSNAVKYTGNGGSVDLTANIIETGPEELQLTYVVKDNGCGMSDEFAERLFQPFQREENELNTSTPGTGLGMCIACSFAELMNGSITVESKLGTGTSVMVKLPLKAVIKNDDSNHIVLNSSNELHGLHFLAAEDNESNAEILKEVLAAMGAECTMTENGQAAVDVFLKSAPGTYDAVLMDIQMPVMDGYKAAKAIRSCKHPDAEEVVIIAMTADAFEEDVQRAFVSGMNAHVAKPLNIQSFIGTIKTLGLN